MTEPWMIDVILIVFLLICSGFFSGSETGVTAVSRARIFHLASDGNKRAKKVSKLREQKEELIGAILLGNNLVNIAATAIATSLAIRLFGDGGVFIATAVLTVTVLIFAEVLPKTYAFRNAERTALFVAPLLSIIVPLFSPFTRIINIIIKFLIHLLRLEGGKGNLISGIEVVRGTIEMHHREGEMVKDDRDMLGGILDLNNVDVGDVMVHRKQIDSVDVDEPVREIIRNVTKSSHSRIPLWKDGPENIIGLLHVKDMIRLVVEHGEHKVSKEMILDAVSEPWFVPETTPLREQLVNFQRERKHFAHVVDEYGVFQGIITLEDIIEEIVGEIEDEHDTENQKLVIPMKDGRYILDGTVQIRDINRALDWTLPDDDASTVAGLLMFEARSIPERGAIFVFYDTEFHVLEKQENQITKLALRKLDTDDDESA